MWCAPRRSSAPMLQMHTVVDRPLTAASKGRISCLPMGLEPIDFLWTGPGGAAVHVDETGSAANGVDPGRYRVVAVDATGARADVTVDLEPTHAGAVVIRAYRVTPTTTSSSRDGSVEAVGIGLHDKTRLLWTHGTVTEGPLLSDVPCGTYVAVPLPHADGTVVPLIHECAPAKVTAGG